MEWDRKTNDIFLSTPHGELETDIKGVVDIVLENLSTPHGELETTCEADLFVVDSQLSTPHGELETSSQQVRQVRQVVSLSTPHGELETPGGTGHCDTASHFQLHTVN